MDIIDVLTAHHATLRNLLRQAETDPTLFEEAIRHLIVHHTMEEKYYYDVLAKLPAGRHDALEYVNEHHIIDLIINDAKDFPRDHERYSVKVEGLAEYVNHHLDEEEMEVFPASRDVLSQAVLDELAVKFEAAKNALLGIEIPEADDVEPQPVESADEPGEVDATTGKAGLGLGIGGLK